MHKSIGLLATVMATFIVSVAMPATAATVYLECTLADEAGNVTHMAVTLNEEVGNAALTVRETGNIEPKITASFTAGDVTFGTPNPSGIGFTYRIDRSTMAFDEDASLMGSPFKKRHGKCAMAPKTDRKF